MLRPTCCPHSRPTANRDCPATRRPPAAPRRDQTGWQNRRGRLARFLGQFRNLLIYVLLGAAATTAALGHLLDTTVILGVVLVNALIGFLQEGKAEQAVAVEKQTASARRHAIVRRLPAIEALGSVTVICSDKTGTLTRNEMTVQEILLADGNVQVGGSGYTPHGALLRDGSELDIGPEPLLREVARGALLCNDARLHRADEDWQVEGDPMEGALLALAGTDIAQMDDARLRETVAEVDVFARASPEHKLRLVEALQARGEIVAMTGDGVNDAPALKRADVGVAMGLRGTEAAKESAEIVLADDNFASISHAVEEGRAVFDNVRKAMLHVLPASGGQSAIILVPILLGMGTTAPITPVQILWVNMVCTVTLALALAFEPPEPNVMQRAPRAPDGPLLPGWRVAPVFGEAFYLLTCRHLSASALSRRGLTGNRKIYGSLATLVLLQAVFVYLPPLQR